MKWITFKEYATWRQEMAEGLWLNDSEAVEGPVKAPPAEAEETTKLEATGRQTEPCSQIENAKLSWTTAGVWFFLRRLPARSHGSATGHSVCRWKRLVFQSKPDTTESQKPTDVTKKVILEPLLELVSFGTP